MTAMNNPIDDPSRLVITPVPGYYDPEDSFSLPMDSVPLVILFCHKSDDRESLVSRLSGYLRSQGYHVYPDSYYHVDCGYYDGSYSLWEVRNKKHEPICRIMEFPERYFFDKHLYDYKKFYCYAHIPIRVFMNHIFRIPCTRLWLLMPDLTELRKEDHYAYDFYIHWLIDRIYPEQMMCLCKESERSFAQAIDDRYTFDIPVFATDTMDIRVLWESIMRTIHPQVSFMQRLKNAKNKLKICIYQKFVVPLHSILKT